MKEKILNYLPVRVRIFHQIDLGGAVTGGIDTIIRGIAAWAPVDVEISVVGLTMDTVARPVGKWCTVGLGSKSIQFFPVGEHNSPMQRSIIPLSVRLAMGVIRYKNLVRDGCDVLDFHRIETSIPFFFDKRPMNLFVHQNMNVLYDVKSDIGWKRFPAGYFLLESLLIPKFSRIFGVRLDAVEAYKHKYPLIGDRFEFISTWMDPRIFAPPNLVEREELKAWLAATYEFDDDANVVVAVGRLDSQKNPLLAISAFSEVVKQLPNSRLIMVGDGVLRADVEIAIKKYSLENHVVLAGLKSPIEIAQILKASDLYLMTSAYEGMPVSVLEAMGTGLPVVSTLVGELSRVVIDGENGFLVNVHDSCVIAKAIVDVLTSKRGDMRVASLRLISEFVPDRTLIPVYRQYRKSIQ